MCAKHNPLFCKKITRLEAKKISKKLFVKEQINTIISIVKMLTAI